MKENQNNSNIEEQIRINVCKKIRASGIPIPLLAKNAQLSVMSIYKVLNAKAMPSLKMAIQLSKALNITLDELLGMPKDDYTSLKPTR